ncbi:hypothetical protein AMAG_16791 [Allomyces macrogynus ATCC 38327]|uniref:Uncharacterized protein n=1 Tax=Allomyces macrogynus (strain ATCC 38327) TaxID=578462 RepID=A0A0L0TBW2_ALLM3|nr:hypothetical protein AMAG_16791 [Allomyces macrogynus ATCC 38327]|eukprot:KNE72303.1 hypothetical protein AMAG_16791 [Allomyces macrogynus ATCC 38327]
MLAADDDDLDASPPPLSPTPASRGLRRAAPPMSMCPVDRLAATLPTVPGYAMARLDRVSCLDHTLHIARANHFAHASFSYILDGTAEAITERRAMQWLAQPAYVPGGVPRDVVETPPSPWELSIEMGQHVTGTTDEVMVAVPGVHVFRPCVVCGGHGMAPDPDADVDELNGRGSVRSAWRAAGGLVSPPVSPTASSRRSIATTNPRTSATSSMPHVVPSPAWSPQSPSTISLATAPALPADAAPPAPPCSQCLGTGTLHLFLAVRIIRQRHAVRALDAAAYPISSADLATVDAEIELTADLPAAAMLDPSLPAFTDHLLAHLVAEMHPTAWVGAVAMRVRLVPQYDLTYKPPPSRGLWRRKSVAALAAVFGLGGGGTAAEAEKTAHASSGARYLVYGHRAMAVAMLAKDGTRNGGPTCHFYL